ncbi:MAG TPA: CHAT domain-containing protein, partial [Pyrinomonadaceae bacterium]|nr:CHAT domain-containing protein [Pyrinomonadaceae bacterium]
LWVELGEASAIEAEVGRLRDALRDPQRADVQTLARAVDERVMRPIRKLVGPGWRLFLSPDGALNLIPLAALVDENGRYLVENYSITYLTSGRDLLRLQTLDESHGTPVVIANPLYDMAAATQPRLASDQARPPVNQKDANRGGVDFTLLNYKPLPGTAEEAAALTKLWPDARVLTQDEATESALKQVHRPRLLHVATHGFFLQDETQTLPEGYALPRGTFDTLGTSPPPAHSQNPLLRSGLLLAGVKQRQSGADEDGVLTALETASLDLWGTKLAVLSACETGLGDVRNGAGVYGLRRALFLAGSEAQVMSLWKVSDGATRDLMTAYYTRLHKGEGRAEALRQVQLDMLRSQKPSAVGDRKRETSDTGNAPAAKDYRHPYYWAAFIQSGDWRSIDGKEAGTR